jgi:hypothetical protein
MPNPLLVHKTVPKWSSKNSTQSTAEFGVFFSKLAQPTEAKAGSCSNPT